MVGFFFSDENILGNVLLCKGALAFELCKVNQITLAETLWESILIIVDELEEESFWHKHSGLV